MTERYENMNYVTEQFVDLVVNQVGPTFNETIYIDEMEKAARSKLSLRDFVRVVTMMWSGDLPANKLKVMQWDKVRAYFVE